MLFTQWRNIINSINKFLLLHHRKQLNDCAVHCNEYICICITQSYTILTILLCTEHNFVSDITVQYIKQVFVPAGQNLIKLSTFR